jgi:hemerythrin-like metal-binding protein
MKLMEWNEALDIGVHDMNNEHKGLLDYMNKLYDLHNSKAKSYELKMILDKLKNATVDHFAHEEAYLDKIGWSNANTHKLIHKNLLNEFSTHYTKFETEGKLTEEFFRFLKFWLGAHIQGIDKKYGDFVNKKTA